MSTQDITHEATIEQQSLLVDAVRAKVAYWDALRKLEVAATGPNGWVDKADSYLVKEIETLAVSWDDSDPHGGYPSVTFKSTVEEALLIQDEES